MRKDWKARSQTRSADIVAQLLKNRDISQDGADAFLDPQYESCYNPLLLKDMKKAVERILTGIEHNEQITVYADYDADAVTAAAVMLRFFQAAGCQNVDYYIPDRFSEGYGVNSDAVSELAERGTKLIVTVDCGINAVSAVDEANQLGIDVVITDHHQLTYELPAAVAVINPKRPDDKYPFKELTGVGVSFKLVQALLKRLERPAAGWEKWLLDLVAVGTVADCVSLLDENRIFVKWGLYVLGKSKWPGINQLVQAAGIRKPFNTYNLGFQIAPRINAAGRIEHASIALDLLLTDDNEKAVRLADRLNQLNSKRQDLTAQILSEAREQIENQADKKILFAAGEGWPKGVLGIVAGRLSQEFYRPVLVMDVAEKEATGSARSVKGFNITRALSVGEEHMISYGGHEQAAGFTLIAEKLQVFRDNLLLYADEKLNKQKLQPVLWYDTEIETTEIDEELVSALEKFEPTGIGNPRPRFLLRGLMLTNASVVGRENQHLKCRVDELDCIGFGLGFWADKLLSRPKKVDAIVELMFNEWNGRRDIQLKIVDMRYAD